MSSSNRFERKRTKEELLLKASQLRKTWKRGKSCLSWKQNVSTLLIASPNVISTNMTRSNKTTVRSNDESIAIEIGKIAREFAELSSEVASYGIEEDFWIRWHFDFEPAWREEYFARVERVTRWFGHESKKESADRSTRWSRINLNDECETLRKNCYRLWRNQTALETRLGSRKSVWEF